MTANATVGTQVRRLFASSPIAGSLFTLVLAYILFSAIVPRFFSIGVFSDIVGAEVLVGTVAVGVTLLMIAGEFDLSVAALQAMGGFLFGHFTAENHLPALAILLALLIPAGLGALNGLILVWTGIPSFIVTLGTGFIYRGAVWVAFGGRMLERTAKLPIYNVFNGRLDILNNLLPGANFRSSALWMIGMVVLFQYILVRTRFGNHVFSVGGNVQAAKAQGVNVKLVKVACFMITGALSGLAGVLEFSQFGKAYVAAGVGNELGAIAAAVVGGTLLTGGSGSVVGALVGVLLISVLRSGVLMLKAVPANNFPAVVGATIVAAAILNHWLHRRA